MSKVKRGLQLSAAIVSIVFNAILFIGSIVLIKDAIQFLSMGYTDLTYLFVLAICIMLFCIADIIVCSLLCIDPDKSYNKKLLLAQSRGTVRMNGEANQTLSAALPNATLIPENNEGKGLTITALVLSSVLVLLYIFASSFVYALIPLISVGLFIAVLCLPIQKQQTSQTQQIQQKQASQGQMQQTKQFATTGMGVNGGVAFQNESAYNFSDPTIANQVTQDTRKEAIRQAVENIEKKSGSSIDENITRIRRLHQEGVLTADEMKQLIMEELKKQN